MSEQRDLIIIGGGPGGYAAALRAAQLGLKTTLIEEDRIGGTCMNYGCIPTKYLLHETHVFSQLKGNPKFDGLSEAVHLNWARVQLEKKAIVERLVKGVEFLLERQRVEILKGKGLLRGERKVIWQGPDEKKEYEAAKIILATGSRSAELPFLKPDGTNVITHLEALELGAVPRSLAVIGAGAIGLEIGVIYSRMGTDVTVVEIMPAILPGMDKPSAARLERLLKKQGLKIHTGIQIDEAAVEPGRVCLKGRSLKAGTAFESAAEKVLLAAGRRPNSETLRGIFDGLLDLAGFVRVNERLETAISGVYAIGDLIGGKLLAHKAQHEGIVAAENCAGRSVAMDYRALPMAVFTDPEFASVGLTEDEARAQGINVQTSQFFLQANGRAVTLGNPEGTVKLIAAPDGRLIGAHLVAPAASEMIPELTLAVQKELTIQDIASTIHIHPTVSEAMMEAALKAEGRAIHALND